MTECLGERTGKKSDVHSAVGRKAESGQTVYEQG